MEITTIVREDTAYWPLFGNPVAMTTATVEFDIPGDGKTTMTFSHREDDPEGMWLADSRIGPNGEPHFIHGAGERSCNKQIAGEQIVASILGWEG